MFETPPKPGPIVDFVSRSGILTACRHIQMMWAVNQLVRQLVLAPRVGSIVAELFGCGASGKSKTQQAWDVHACMTLTRVAVCLRWCLGCCWRSTWRARRRRQALP
eukprot:SAG22_NODE_684_length_7918_cov_6.380356_2_plen_106_part_00